VKRFRRDRKPKRTLGFADYAEGVAPLPIGLGILILLLVLYVGARMTGD
jgi:hypothetical protein